MKGLEGFFVAAPVLRMKLRFGVMGKRSIGLESVRGSLFYDSTCLPLALTWLRLPILLHYHSL